MKEAKITYLYHSGFSIETDNHFLVFDYYKDSIDLPADNFSKGVISIETFPNNKEIYVFVTHSHGDHFNPVIFKWSRDHKITYILSNDVEVIDYSQTSIYSMKPYEVLSLSNIIVKSFGTTDKGLSFLVAVDGINIFHSGDLNWWHWKSFPKEDQLREEDDYKREVERLTNEEIDIAFVPVDPRLEEFAFLAGEYFVKKIKPTLCIPMHFADTPEISQQFLSKIDDSPTIGAVIKSRGQEFIFKK